MLDELGSGESIRTVSKEEWDASGGRKPRVQQPGLLCPKCGSSLISLLSTTRKPDSIKRRRLCDACGFRFNSIETLAIDCASTQIMRWLAGLTQHKASAPVLVVSTIRDPPPNSGISELPYNNRHEQHEYFSRITKQAIQVRQAEGTWHGGRPKGSKDSKPRVRHSPETPDNERFGL